VANAVAGRSKDGPETGRLPAQDEPRPSLSPS
jgi:hypothetical protein